MIRTRSKLLIPFVGISRDQYGSVRARNTSRVLIPTVGRPPFRGAVSRDQYVRATRRVLIPKPGSVPNTKGGQR